MPSLAGLAAVSNYYDDPNDDLGPFTGPETPHQYVSTSGEAFAAGAPLSATSLALGQFLVVKSGPATLYGVSVYSNKATAQFIQLFDAQVAPASGAIPVAVYTVGGTSNLGLYWGSVGRWFNQGIVIANSSTAATQTAGSADCFFDAQYL